MKKVSRSGKGISSRRRRGPARVDTPVKELNKKETLVHYQSVLLEEVRSQMQQVVESVDSGLGEMRREIGDFREEVNGRFELVEKAIRHVRDELKGDIASVRGDMASMEGRLTEKIGGIGERVEDHEERITALETTNRPQS